MSLAEGYFASDDYAEFSAHVLKLSTDRAGAIEDAFAKVATEAI